MAVRPPSPLDFVTPADLVRFGDKLLAQIKVLIEQTRPAALLRLPEVMRRTGYGRSSIYQKIAEGTFPAPRDLGGGHGKAWRSDEVEQWINSRPRCSAAIRSEERGEQRTH